MNFAEPNLEVHILVLANGDFRLSSNSRETVRTLLVLKAARDRAKIVYERSGLAKPGRDVCVDMEVVLELWPDGRWTQRVSRRDPRILYLALRAAARRLEDSLHHRRLSRTALLLPSSHCGVIERV